MPELQSALERVVLHKIDVLKGDGPRLEKQFQVSGRPTFVLLNAGGETVGRWGGYTEADEFIENLSAGLQDPTTIEDKRARFASRPNLADAEGLARFHETRDEYRDALRYYGEAQKLAAGSGRDFRFALFDVTADGASDGEFTLAEAKQAADAALAYEGRTLDQVLHVAIGIAYLGQKKQDRDIMVPYLELAMRASEGSADEGIQRQRKEVAPFHVLYVQRDEAKAVELRKRILGEGWQEDSRKLTSFASWCLKARVNLAEAEALARKAADLAREETMKAWSLGTLAEICDARGKREEAVRFMELAVAADPRQEYPRKLLEQFRKSLAAH